MDKKYKVLLICLVVYIVIMGVILVIGKKSDTSHATIFVDDESRWIYNGNKWSKISDKNIDSYSWKKYNIYDSDGFLGNYYLMKNGGSNRWYIFDNDKNSIQKHGDIVAFGGNMKHDVKDFKMVDISSDEYEYVQEVLSDLKIKDNNIDDFTVSNKYLVDLDNDGVDEEFYSVSNAFSISKKSKDFSVVFLRKENKNIIMYKLIEDSLENTYGGCAPVILSVFTLSNDKKPKIIVNCEFYSGTSLYNKLYDYDLKSNGFKNLLTDFYSQ